MNSYNLDNIIDSNSLIKRIIYHDEVTSTNNVAKDLLREEDFLKNNFLILSDYQTRGRGKNNAYFFSPKDVGIYMSIVLVNLNYDLRSISIAASLTIFRVIKKYISADIKIKWPNDILVNGKKVCGILIEASTQGNKDCLEKVIIGVGINVNNSYFDSKIEDIATSLRKESGLLLDRNKIVIEVLVELKSVLNSNSMELFEEYLENLESNSFEKLKHSGLFDLE